MGDWPAAVRRRAALTPWGEESAMWPMLLKIGVGWNDRAWPAANRALFFPVRLSEAAILRTLFVGNGGQTSGYLDLGIYSYGLSRIVSTGSTLQFGTSDRQTVDVADTVLDPGWYYLAMAMDNTDAQVAGGTFSDWHPIRFGGCFQQASAFPLPATASPAARTAGCILPWFGAHLLRSP